MGQVITLNTDSGLTYADMNFIESFPGMVGFVFGAFKKGFAVTLPGSFEAKYKTVRICCHVAGEGKRVWITERGHTIVDMPFESFYWSNIKIIKGCVYYKDRYVFHKLKNQFNEQG